MSKNIAIRHKQADGYDTLYPNSNSTITSFDPKNTIKNPTNQFSSIHNPMYSTNIQEAIEELDANISSHGRTFEKVQIPPYLSPDPNDVKTAYSTDGEYICILDMTTNSVTVSLDGGETWKFKSYGNIGYEECYDVVYDEQTLSFWVLQSSHLAQIITYGVTGNIFLDTYSLPDKVGVGGSFGIYSSASVINFIINGTRQQVWKGTIRLSGMMVGDISNANYWSILITMPTNDQLFDVVCNPNGFAIILVYRTISSSYVAYTYDFSTGSFTNQILGGSVGIPQITVGETNGSMNVILLTSTTGTNTIYYQEPQTNLIWVSLTPSVDVGYTFDELYFANDYWCAKVTNFDTLGDYDAFAISDTKSISNPSKSWNIGIVQQSLPSEYQNIINNGVTPDGNFRPVLNVADDGIVNCVGICPSFKDSTMSPHFFIITTTGYLMSVNAKGVRDKVSNRAEFIVTTTPYEYEKIIKGRDDFYLALSSYDEANSSVLSFSLDCKTWLSLLYQNDEIITDIMYINEDYWTAGWDVNESKPVMHWSGYRSNKKWLGTFSTHDSCRAQIATNMFNIIVTITTGYNSSGTGVPDKAEIYGSPVVDPAITLKSSIAGGWNGCQYTGCGSAYILMWKGKPNSSNTINGQAYSTTDGKTLTEIGGVFTATGGDPRVIGKDESTGNMYVYNTGNEPWRTPNVGTNWYRAETTSADWRNVYTCPKLNINGYYLLLKNNKLYYTDRNPLMDTSFDINTQTKPVRMPVTEADIRTILNIDDKIFALTGSLYTTPNEVWISTTT